ncbi:MAG: hypothetical protein BAJALOKI1v1_1870006 [Promethearchaeota archaeon]|nr:MAG: hypothetical protein BAJALOKI1v1_1870006 [Candidatus Lokiarchaeota archaeon]
MSSLIRDKILPKEIKLSALLNEVELVGGIYNMGYEECLVLTNDSWKQNAGGIPKHCFLLASVMEPDKAPLNDDDEEIILLRVIGPAQLPSEKELINVRSDAMREIITEKGRKSIKEPSQIVDILTRNEIQFSGIEAKILGTFYEIVVEGQRVLKFGNDIDNFYSSSRYKVYKPYGKSLSIISSYPQITEQEERERQSEGTSPKRIKIGTVRYGSTLRRSRKIEDTKPISVPVKVNIKDFISMKTAIFGMTRLGKSNTMKIIATAVFQYAIQNNEKIGQLLFDPAGEYANVNPQDKTALSQLGEEFVVIFRYGADAKKKNEKSLRLNFYEESIIPEVWAMIQRHVIQEGGSQYFKTFSTVDVIGPNDEELDRSRFNRAKRRRAALYATLMKAEFNIPKNFKIDILARKDLINLINGFLGKEFFKTKGRGTLTLTKDNMYEWWDIILKIHKTNSKALEFNNKAWIDSELEAILEIYDKPRGRIGYNILTGLKKFHTSETSTDYVEEIIIELKKGKIVIVDLSLGNEAVLQYCSERIINGLLKDSANLFRKNLPLSKIQIFIEEAHRLFNRTKFEKPDSDDPYVRLAKEAAKYEIGLIYATQEVTSVDSQVLANTSNWIVTHLNNHKEVNELSKYYNFKDFYTQIIQSEDVGFARIKTRSGRYIIPTQIDLFSAERIKNAKDSLKQLEKEEGE